MCVCMCVYIYTAGENYRRIHIRLLIVVLSGDKGSPGDSQILYIFLTASSFSMKMSYFTDDLSFQFSVGKTGPCREPMPSSKFLEKTCC